MVKALADRLAEAFAERMHERVRRELWGYAPDERFAPEELIAERTAASARRRAIPAQPDHTEKATLFALLDAEARIGRAAHRELRHVAGLVGLRPLLRPSRGHYFGVGKVERDQVEDYAARKGMAVDEVERWLGAGPQLRPGAARSAA